MLKIGQRVRIEDEPSIGYQYFYRGNINTYDWIAGIRVVGDECYYRLQSEDYDCLWHESELHGRDKFLFDDKPAFNIGDELLLDKGTVTTGLVTCIVRRGDIFEYKIGNEGRYIPEYKLKRYHKYDSDAVYTLF